MQPLASTQRCPEHVVLLALVEGQLSDEETTAVSEHIEACERCDARLEQIEEASDPLIRALASLPASEDDEPTFRTLQEQLLANPLPFEGESLPQDAATMDWADMDFPATPYSVLQLPFQLGNYELLEQIGAGSHGAVFRARHRRLEREVAVKLLLRASSQFVDEFLHEMRVVGKLDHPNIIRATDAGEHDGVYFLVMEFVPGLDVSSLLRRTGPLPLADACEIARQCALGLEVAHRNELVHRDVKTSNLLFTHKGEVKILDLGLATIASGGPSAESGQSGQSSGPRGTADYMAPEQWHARAVTGKADLYSLGCTLFKLITGSPPFRPLPDNASSLQEAHLNNEPPTISSRRDDIPAELDRLVSKLLAKDPDDRPATAREVATMLEPFADESNLFGLLSQHCSELTSQRTEEVNQRRPARRRQKVNVRRRVLLLMTFAVAATGLAVANVWLFPHRAPIDTGSWRSLAPARPALLNYQPESGTTLDRRDDGTLMLDSPELALLHFGKPLTGAYRWRATLQRKSWEKFAGVFFRLRKSGEDGLAFHTFEIHDPDGGNSPGTVTILWRSYDTNSGEVIDLAETHLRGSNGSSEFALEVTVGRSGLPGLACNDQRVHQSDWTLSKDARDFVVANVDQLAELYAGRIGVVQHSGQTSVDSPELLYLPD